VIIGLAIQFILELKRLTLGFMVRVMPFLYSYSGGTQENRVMRGERSIGVGSDGVIEMVLLCLYRFMVGWLDWW